MYKKSDSTGLYF